MARRVAGMVMAVAVLMSGAACDSGGGGGSSVASFCRLVEESNPQAGETSSEQIDAIVDAFITENCEGE